MEKIPVISMKREKCEWGRDCATAQREVLECSEDTEHGELCVFLVDLVMSLLWWDWRLSSLGLE